ncbi:hypothetical protein [Duganella sp. P38]|jgi:DNA-binding FrmR family transcriptional regulator|uniref:hypothetical protein n=1 Tax=Duganella sp. P38 TaxID=3423949 RepID=UPI003D7A2F14
MLSVSTNFSASTDAYMELLQKQMETARKNAEVIDRLSTRVDQDQKAQARQRVEEIKKEIEALRKMLMLFGGKDAKAVLQQLKHLASQLKQAAGVLKASTETGLPDVTSAATDVPAGTEAPPAESETADEYAEGRNAYAEQQASADAEAAGVQLPVPRVDTQRAQDEKELELVTRALKSLRATVEHMVKKQEVEARR